MKSFEYFEPSTLEEAVYLLERYNGRASVLAGGTDLLVEMKEGLRTPAYVINIKHIAGMDYLSYDEEEGLRIGSLVTIRAVETSQIVQKKYAGLAQAASDLGSIQIRNRATVAGNICRASPSADTLPSLIADQATIRVFGSRGERNILLEKFFAGPGQTVLTQDEVLTEIIVPAPPPRTGKVYFKHGRRKAMELASVGVAVTLTLESDICQDIRIVLGAVAPTPIRALKAEEVLRNNSIDRLDIAAAAQAAMVESRPISDVRSSADYRREMVRVLTSRAIRQALEMAKSV
ncbi:MAG: xanthine dehydrogenase family protein subunit M [Chloroflexi bacterium]|nr:xanthine dehydrogenase family protein subunit M [Chloroflexota bacterium]